MRRVSRRKGRKVVLDALQLEPDAPDAEREIAFWCRSRRLSF